MAKLTDEQLERKLDDLKHRYAALEEEYREIRLKIKHKDYTQANLVSLIERLRDNLKSRELLVKEVRNAFKDHLDLVEDWLV